MNATAAITYSTAIPAVSFRDVTGGIRVRRDGKGDTFLVTRDERARSPWTFLIIQHGQGVVGRVALVDGEWFIERGIFRAWDHNRGAFQVFPSSTVETFWGFASFEDAVAHEALWFLS